MRPLQQRVSRWIHPSLPAGLCALGAVWGGGLLGLGTWSVHLSIPIGIALLIAAYALCVGPLRERGGWGAPVPWEQWTSFVAGTTVLFAALTGPIHVLSDSYLFSAHMIQHLLITLLVPPLIWIGTPAWLVRRALALPGLDAVARTLGSPPVAFLIFNGTLALWHLPVLYNSTLIRIDIHITEHLLFIATAFIGWWPVLAPAHEYRAAIAFQLIYMLLMPFPMKIVGMLITLSDTVLYPAYALAPRVYGLDVLLDQQIGGIIMWVPAGFVFWITLGCHFFRWFGEARAQDLRQTNVVPLTQERVT